MSVSCLKESTAKTGVGVEVGTADRAGMSLPCGLKLTESHLSAIANKDVEKLTAGITAPEHQGEEVNRASFAGRTLARQVSSMAITV